RCFASDPVCLDRLSDVLHLLLTEIDELDRQLRPDVVPNNTRDADDTGLSKSLQPSRDVDPIAEQIVALHDDVADVDADPKPHLLARRSVRILLGDGLLNLDGTFNGVDRTGEVRDEAIARGGEDPAPMRRDQPICDGPVRREGAERADLVLSY